MTSSVVVSAGVVCAGVVVVGVVASVVVCTGVVCAGDAPCGKQLQSKLNSNVKTVSNETMRFNLVTPFEF